MFLLAVNVIQGGFIRGWTSRRAVGGNRTIKWQTRKPKDARVVS